MLLAHALTDRGRVRRARWIRLLSAGCAAGWLATAGAGVPAGANPSLDPCIAAGGTPGTTAVPLQLTCAFATPNDGSTPTYTFGVPSAVTSLTLDAFGGQGGGTASAAGGHAGEARGTFTGLGGSALTIVVAGSGATAGSGGFPDGGNGGSRTGDAGGGGGGGSSVSSAAGQLVVAGGGGGAGDTVQISGFPTGGKGADAAQSGGPAQAGTTSGACCNTVLGGGGGYNAGGAAGAGGRTTVGSCSASTSGVAGQAGSAGGGGAGGSPGSAGSGGGGGGGDLGGGGGGSGADCDAFHSGGGGGGGGSSFVDPAASSPAMPVGHSGDGMVVVTYTLPAPGNLVLDGGFEKPIVGGPLITLSSGSKLGAWQVTAGSVDLVGSYWVPAAGAQSVDLAGDAPGTLSQTLSLPYADRYRIRFWIAANPGCGTSARRMGVLWNGVLVATRRFDPTGHTLTNLGWVRRAIVVTGLPGPAAIGFSALNSGPCGPALDRVTVTYL